MKIRRKHIFSCVCSLLASLAVYAQELPLLPSDPAVTQGVLPNGMSYYIASNTSSKGMADFALVQKTGTRTGDGPDRQAISVAKDAMTALPRLRSGSPQSFLTSHGVTPGRDGFVKVTENATVFLFDNVIISRNASVLDSTLLVLLDIVDRVSTTEDGYVRRWYSPSDQAVIVAGDVDPKSVVEKLRYMSLMTPPHESLPREEYVWEDVDTMTYVTTRDTLRNIATITATWRSPRTPREYMNTVQPAIYDMFVGELGHIAAQRISRVLHGMDIPVAAVSHKHVNSVESLADEQFMMSVSVAPEHAHEAAGALAHELAALDAGNASVEEFREARRAYFDAMKEEDRKPLRRNSDYVDRCVSAFLYNATLASQKEKLVFHSSRNLEDTTEMRLFNGIVSALMDSTRNLTLEYRQGRLQNDTSGIRQVFDSTWRKGYACRSDRKPDSLIKVQLPGPGPKARLRSTEVEPMSGGQIWTFSNGFKIIYRKMSAYDNVYYSLALNGGTGSIKDLEDGEGAYMSDYLGLCRIGGVPGSGFRKFLGSEGMTMDSEVSLTGMKISGHAPEDKVETMIRSLLAVLNSRSHDEKEFDYYVRTENLRHEILKGSVEERTAAIDSIMCPDYIYSSHKATGKLTTALGAKADAYYERQSSKVNDGVLVLVGDLDEVALKKILTTYAGAFRTTGKAFPRPLVRYQPVSGWSTYTMTGDVNSVDIVMSAPLTLTSDNIMAASVASLILRQSLSEAIVSTGMYLRLKYRFDIYPQERLSVMVSLNEAYKDGFSSDTHLTGPIDALRKVRNSISDLARTPVSASDLAAYKSLLKERLKFETEDPRYWTDAIAMRYTDGKDFTTGAAARIDAVTVDKVKAILASLNEGCKIEYTIRKR